MASDDKNDGKAPLRKLFDDPYVFDLPDATYDDLPELIGNLKRAAIDAYVRDKLAPSPALLTLAEDHYLITVNSGADGGSSTHTPRPHHRFHHVHSRLAFLQQALDSRQSERRGM